MAYKKQKSQRGMEWWLNRSTNKAISLGKRASWFKYRYAVSEFVYGSGRGGRTRYFKTKSSAMKAVRRIIR